MNHFDRTSIEKYYYFIIIQWHIVTFSLFDVLPSLPKGPLVLLNPCINADILFPQKLQEIYICCAGFSFADALIAISK